MEEEFVGIISLIDQAFFLIRIRQSLSFFFFLSSSPSSILRPRATTNIFSLWRVPLSLSLTWGFYLAESANVDKCHIIRLPLIASWRSRGYRQIRMETSMSGIRYRARCTYIVNSKPRPPHRMPDRDANVRRRRTNVRFIRSFSRGWKHSENVFGYILLFRDSKRREIW